MNIQKTQLSRFQNKLWKLLTFPVVGPWKKRSTSFLSLLIGFYLGSNLTVFYLEKIGKRPLVTLLMVLVVEAMVRIRSLDRSNNHPTLVNCLDNLRIGSVYAVVLEAFKLGS